MYKKNCIEKRTMKQTIYFDTNGVAKCSFPINSWYEQIKYSIASGSNAIMNYVSIDGEHIGGTWECEKIISPHKSSRSMKNTNKVGNLEFTIELFKGDIKEPITIEVELIEQSTRYYKIDTHVHTTESDGGKHPYEIAKVFQNLGYEAIFLTDHNSISQNFVTHGSNPIALFPGCEYTTRKGHINVLGISPNLRFALDNRDELYDQLQQYKNKGALISLNHPFDNTCHACDFSWGFDNLSIFDSFEVWNYSWFINGESLASCNQQSLKWWQQQLCQGIKLFAISGSDFHDDSDDIIFGHKRDYYYPVLNVHARYQNASDLIANIRAGHCFITKRNEEVIFESTILFGEHFTINDTSTILNQTNMDRLEIITDTDEQSITLSGPITICLKDFQDAMFVRFEIWRDENKLSYPICITNPFFNPNFNLINQ